MFPAKIVRVAPYLKFYVSLVTVIAMAVTVPLGSPFWLTIVIAALNALGVFFTPNMEGRYEYPEPEEVPEHKPEDPFPDIGG